VLGSSLRVGSSDGDGDGDGDGNTYLPVRGRDV